MSGCFLKYWRNLIEKNPPLGTEGQRLNLSVESFQKAQEQAFEAGRQAQIKLREAADELREKYGKSPFEKLFGGPF